MPTVQCLLRNQYRDSIALMQFSKGLGEQSGVRQASAVMATPGNLSLLVEAGLLPESPASSPNDLLIVLEGDDPAVLNTALQAAVEKLNRRPAAEAGEGPMAQPPRSLGMALQAGAEEANLVLISTPGGYAAAEALKALRHGRHVMIFSDNVSLDDEIMLKQYARECGLLVMGPDCGTAIVNGLPLGFANVVRRGPIGLIGASGTGTQQVTCLIDRWGGGVSHALGLGSHDLHHKVGGLSMLTALEALAEDPGTHVIVLISKPPAPEVARLVLDRAAALPKPVVVDFLGADPASVARPGLVAAVTLEHAAALAVALAADEPPPHDAGLSEGQAALAGAAAGRLGAGQRYLRGLFSGGTFCYESLLLLSSPLGVVYSNTPLRPEHRLENVWRSQAHTAIDLGDDVFTQGRPHPMIDFRLRAERLVAEAHDPEVGLILLDVVLGYGSHADPAGELIPAIHQARAAAPGAPPVFVAFVCGTEADPQQLSRQEAALREAGVLLCDSNAQAARLAGAIINVVQERAP
jgi:FdrA protein